MPTAYKLSDALGLAQKTDHDLSRTLFYQLSDVEKFMKFPYCQVAYLFKRASQDETSLRTVNFMCEPNEPTSLDVVKTGAPLSNLFAIMEESNWVFAQYRKPFNFKTIDKSRRLPYSFTGIEPAEAPVLAQV